MKTLSIKKFLLLSLILGSAFVFFSGSNSAYAADCTVTSATFSPNGLYPYKALVDATDKTSYIVKMTINTQNCSGKRLDAHITEEGRFFNTTVSSVDRSLWQLPIGSTESLTLNLLPGEESCYINPCSYFISIDKSSDGTGPTAKFDTSSSPGGKLSYDCVGSCSDPWIANPNKDDLGGNVVNGGSSTSSTTSYDLLAPLPGFTGTFNTGGGLTNYLKILFQLLIGIAGILAVLMIVIGGIEYMSTDALSGKSEGKERVTQAILGLLIALGAWLLLNTINPDILSLSLLSITNNPQNITVIGGEDIPQTTTAGGNVCSGLYKIGNPWPSDAVERADLVAFGISFNNGNCAKVGQDLAAAKGGLGGAACTSVYQLSPNAIAQIKTLKTASGANIKISGGTECWDHIANSGKIHYPGGSAVDVRPDSILDAYIGLKPNTCQYSPFSKDGIKARIMPEGSCDGTGPHWHIEFQ